MFAIEKEGLSMCAGDEKLTSLMGGLLFLFQFLDAFP